MKHFTHTILSALFLLAGLISCQQDESIYAPQPTPEGEGYALSFISDPLNELKVTTRSSDPKDDEEKRINRLYIFFFGSDGNYLEGGYLEGYGNAPEQGGYYAPGEGVTTLKISNETTNFTNPDLAENATVYAVANVDPTLFRELDDNDRPSKIKNLSDLENLIYAPTGNLSVGLPANGMPMVGKKEIDLTSTTNEQDRTIDLKALMARIDVNIQLNSDITDNRLPSMLLTRWTVKNVPTQVAFAEPTDNSETNLTNDTKKDIIGSERTQQIYNNQGNIAFTFYMFENRQNPNGTTITYPDGIEEYQKQRYKPQLANDNATYVEIQSEYTTYNNATYTVTYKLYLGSNHTDNFQVKRNHQYKNDITIKGLLGRDYADTETEEGEKYTFDARVNVSEEANKYYIAMLRERNHDAHFCVTPMDVYLFDESTNPSMTIEFENGTDLDNGQPWIRMEKICATDMESGNVSNSGFTAYDPQNNPNGTHLATGTAWTAGNGKRAFFTTDLVTNTLAETGKTITINNSRDRVYFYIDENLSDSEDRTAVVKLTYTDANGTKEFRTLDITQTHFLRVQVYGRTGNRPDYNSPYSDDNDYDGEDGVIYMEQYEEYLDHYDPLDDYATEQIYTGLPWGLSGISISDPENYLKGLQYTGSIIEEAAHGIMTLNDTPRSAAEYCYNRNKREENGEVYYNAEWHGIGIIGYYTYQTNRKYFLPGIRQMEDALTQYYTTFPEFQGNFYWSSAAGKPSIVGQDRNRARATKVNADGSYVESADGDNYPNGGATLRTEPLRIRAFRSDLEPLQY